MSSFYSSDSCHNVSDLDLGAHFVASVPPAMDDDQTESSSARLRRNAAVARFARDEARAKAKLQAKLAKTFDALAELSIALPGLDGATTVSDLEFIIG